MTDIKVGLIMGSQSDWPTMREAAQMLDALDIAYETRIVSAHRTPDRLWDYGVFTPFCRCRAGFPWPQWPSARPEPRMRA